MFTSQWINTHQNKAKKCISSECLVWKNVFKLCFMNWVSPATDCVSYYKHAYTQVNCYYSEVTWSLNKFKQQPAVFIIISSKISINVCWLSQDHLSRFHVGHVNANQRDKLINLFTYSKTVSASLVKKFW